MEKQPLAFARGVSCWSDVQGTRPPRSSFPVPPRPRSLSWFPSVVGGAPSFVVGCPSSFVRCGSARRRWFPSFVHCPVCALWRSPFRSSWVGSDVVTWRGGVRSSWRPPLIRRGGPPFVRRGLSPLVRPRPRCQISPWYSPCEQWLTGVLAGASAVVRGGSVVGWFRVPSLVVGCGPSRSSWWFPLRSLVVVPFVRRGLSPLVRSSWWSPLRSLWVVTLHSSSWGCPVRSSWWSPSFVVCGPPLPFVVGGPPSFIHCPVCLSWRSPLCLLWVVYPRSFVGGSPFVRSS
jgi:hypothetical protein